MLSTPCFRGRPRWMWRPLLNSSLSTVQKDPKSSSTLTKHLCRERLVRTAPWKGEEAPREGREGEEQPGQMQWPDRQMDRQTENGQVRRLGNAWPNTNSHCGSQQAAVGVQRCTAKLAASQFSSTAHKMMWIWNRFSINQHHETGGFGRAVERGVDLPADLLWPSLLELYLVNSPYRPFNVFYSHKTLVKTKVMPDCVLQLVWKKRKKSISIKRNKPMEIHYKIQNYTGLTLQNWAWFDDAFIGSSHLSNWEIWLPNIKNTKKPVIMVPTVMDLLRRQTEFQCAKTFNQINTTFWPVTLSSTFSHITEQWRETTLL